MLTLKKIIDISIKNTNKFYNNSTKSIIYSNISYSRSFTTNNNKNDYIEKRDILSKDLRDIGIYLPEEVDDEFDDEGNYIDDEYSQMNKNDANLLRMVEHQQNAQQLENKILGIDESNLFGNVPTRDISDAQQEWDQLEYENKQKVLNEIQPMDFEEKIPERVELYNTISNNFSVIDEQHKIHFKTDDQEVVENEPHYSDIMPEVNIASNDDLSTRISKIRQKLQKNKTLSGRLVLEDLNRFYQLYREDPKVNNAESLANQFSIDVKTAENLLKYFTIPIVVKYNTGLKSGHWSVIFEK